LNHDVPAAELAAALGIEVSRAEAVYADIRNKRRTTRYLHARPLLAGEIFGTGSI
jgi:NAD+ synthase